MLSGPGSKQVTAETLTPLVREPRSAKNQVFFITGNCWLDYKVLRFHYSQEVP